MIKILTIVVTFLITSGSTALLQAQPGGGDWDGMNCAEYDAEHCEELPFCEIAEDGSCVESDWHGGDWDGMNCAEYDAEHCEELPFCEIAEDGSCVESDWHGGDWDGMNCAEYDAEHCEELPFCEIAEDGSCVESDWHGGDWDGMNCAEYDAEHCEELPFCELNDVGECVANDWGWGDCGNGDYEFGYGNWNWGEGGFSLGDINMDELVNVQDIIKELSFILEEALPNDYEFWAGDLNVDEVLNVLDIVDIVETILGRQISSYHSGAELTGSTLNVQGTVAAIQANGILISKVEGEDILASENGKTVVYNMSGVLDTDSFTFTSTPSEVIVASTSGERVDINVSLPNSINLGKAYPNPFNPSTSMNLNLPIAGFVNMQVVNLKGQVVSTLLDGYMEAGNHTLTWNAMNMTSGMYFVKVKSGGYIETQKLMLVK